MSAAGNHIRQEKRKEIHEPFLESKSTGVEHLKSGQLTVYLWMRRDVGRFCPGKFVPVLMIGGQVLTFQGKTCSVFTSFNTSLTIPLFFITPPPHTPLIY